MKALKLKLKANSYNILVGNRILSRLGLQVKALRIGQDAVIITNRVIQKFHGKDIASGLSRFGLTSKFIVIPDSEQSKSAKVAMRVIEQIAHYDVQKKVFIVAFGGGVIGDLAGYVAAIYKRGVPYIQVPTTLLGQIDSAIGGKVAIDLAVGKNLVGAFYQPRLVFSDVALLKTLDKRQIRNGLAEAVKYGVIRDAKLFFFLEKHYCKILAAEPSVLTEVVLRCSKIKADVVSQDEKETKGIRTILNFGHTVGHAIETAGGYDLYHHGEAIALGMLVASDMARQMGFFQKEDSNRLELLIDNIGLPVKIKKMSLSRILSVMSHDKKFIGGKNRFVLPLKLGKVKVIEGVSSALIRDSIVMRMNSY